MKKRSSLALLLALSLFVTALGQNPQNTPAPAPQQQDADDGDVVRITTNLVQVDAVITDKNNRLVTDLRPEEVEILEDGRAQKITNFTFVSTSAEAPPAQPDPAPKAKTALPVPPVRLKPEQVRRTIALVVDDLGLSFESTYYVRQALKKFVDQQVQPGDLVAIIRTAGGMGALQQFTSDRRQLYAAIERVKWYPMGRGGVGAFAPMESDPLQRMRNEERQRGGGGGGGRPGAGGQQRDAGGDREDSANRGREELDQFREELFSVGTLGALNYVVRGMRDLPGRKSVLLMSDGIKIFNLDDPGRSSRVLEALRGLTDLANRASVVIYTMDARGLQTLGLTAADNTSDYTPDQIEQRLSDRRSDFFDSQHGLDYIARQTGGFAIRNNNDLSAGIRRVLEDQKGYYLIGYRPDESTFDPATGRRKFHQITLKLKRPGLKHRTRTGFYGVTDEEARPTRLTREQQLSAALTSPFGTGGVQVRLTSVYLNDAKAGSFVRSLFHVEGRDLTFTDEADGWHKATIDVVAVTFGDNGRVVDEVSATHNLKVRGETYKRLLENGFVYNLSVPVKKPGAYQLRAVVRDATSERVGSASQFIEVPDIKKNRLALSGVIADGLDPKALEPKPQAAGQAESGAENFDLDPQASPAVRRFRRGLVMRYAYTVYNAQPDKATGRPAVQTQVRLFREGQEIFAGQQQPLNASGQVDPKRLTVGGALQLGTNLPPGEYALQVVVTDPLAKEKYRTATQWVDFEIVK